MTAIDHRIFILRHPDEMRHPYEGALRPYCAGIEWFSTLDDLLKNPNHVDPTIVIVDLDTLPKPLASAFEQIRTTYSQSDLIAISTDNSAKIAIQCIHSGFSDFLLKPTSPEELAWSIRKSSQRQDIFHKLDDPRSSMLRAAGQISSAATPTLVRLSTLQYLQRLLSGLGAVWLGKSTGSRDYDQILCSIPKQVSPNRLLSLVPKNWMRKQIEDLSVIKTTKDNKYKMIMPCDSYPNEAVLLWGIPGKIPTASRSDARFLLEHSQLSLMNLQRFEEIKQQTFVDDLTGLYNSRYLKFALTNAIQKCKQPHQVFSVLFIDVDHFKQINDKHGHLIGSQFLVTIGKTVRNAIRSIDPVFRYGGDEFVVILHDTSTQGAMEIAERIRKNIERRVFVFEEQRIRTTVSIGIAAYPEHATEQESLLRLADEAMYSAKKESRNSVHLAYGINGKPAKPRQVG